MRGFVGQLEAMCSISAHSQLYDHTKMQREVGNAACTVPRNKGKQFNQPWLVQWIVCTIGSRFKASYPCCVCVVHCRFSHVCLFVSLWTTALQAPVSRGFSRQKYWNELPCRPPGDLPDPGLKPCLLHCSWILYPLSHGEAPPTYEGG